MADPLTAEQREVWDELRMDERPTGGPDGETAEFRAASFRHICRLEGVEPPSEDAVLEALRA